MFGPVLTVQGYGDEPAALRMANATDYGLAGAFNPAAPFGGYRRLGNGRELGRWGIEELLETKSLQL